jgi:hypothetical protein
VKHAAIDIHPRERRRAADDHVSFSNYLVRFITRFAIDKPKERRAGGTARLYWPP